MNSIKQLEKAQKDSKIDLYSLKGTKWKLIFSTDDNTRSSPLFWAFTKALTENSNAKHIAIIVFSFDFIVSPYCYYRNLNIFDQTVNKYIHSQYI